MADSSAKRKQHSAEMEGPAEQIAQALPDIKLSQAKLHKQLGKLKVQARFGAGATRRHFRQVQAKQEAEENTPSHASTKQNGKISTGAGDSATPNSITTFDDIGSYLGNSPLDICNQVINALANGEALNISASEMPRADIPAEAQGALADLWAGDIQRLEANLPLRPQNTPTAAAVILQEKSALALPQAIPDAEKYQPRQGIVDFLENCWPAPYIKAGVLTRPELRHLDPNADMALRNWLRKNELPEHLRMPNRTEVAQQMADDPEGVRHAWRVVAAHARRQGPQRE